LNKQEAIAMVSQIVEGTKVESEKYVEAVLKVFEYCVENKESLKFVGHFSMEVVDRAEKNGVNPKTQEKIVIPATKAVRFKIGKKLKEMAKA